MPSLLENKIQALATSMAIIALNSGFFHYFPIPAQITVRLKIVGKLSPDWQGNILLEYLA
jgi:hypothetical protein